MANVPAYSKPILSLGDTYYTVPPSGTIGKKAVISTPFMWVRKTEHQRRRFATAADALLVAGPLLKDALEKTDSMSEARAIGKERKARKDSQSYVKFLEQLPAMIPTGSSGTGKPEPVSFLREELEKTYALPGEEVWMVVTPNTHRLSLSAWRPPELFFVFRATVQSVSLINGKLAYSFLKSTQHCPQFDEVLLGEDEAKKYLEKILFEMLPITGVNEHEIAVYTEQDEQKVYAERPY